MSTESFKSDNENSQFKLEGTENIQDNEPIKKSPELEEMGDELLIKYEALKENREKQKQLKKEIKKMLGEVEDESSPYEDIEQNNEHMKEVVSKMQQIFTEGAEKFLPEESTLRKDVVQFYSDPDRLYNELSYLFKGTSNDEIDERVEAAKERFADKNTFLNYVVDKDYSVTS